MSRQGLIVSGAVIMGIGVVITAATYSSASSGGGGSYVVMYGAIAVGLFRIIRGLATPEEPQAYADPDQMYGRDGPPDPRPQLAGAKCVHCGKKIMSAIEAFACKDC